MADFFRRQAIDWKEIAVALVLGGLVGRKTAGHGSYSLFPRVCDQAAGHATANWLGHDVIPTLSFRYSWSVAMTPVKYRLFEPRLNPRRTKMEVPGWSGQPEPRRDGSHEF